MEASRVAAVGERVPVHHKSVSSRRVLVVDDEHAVRLVVAETLRRGGFEVVAAVDGEEALLALDTHPDLDLVITDMVKPFRPSELLGVVSGLLADAAENGAWSE